MNLLYPENEAFIQQQSQELAHKSEAQRNLCHQLKTIMPASTQRVFQQCDELTPVNKMQERLRIGGILFATLIVYSILGLVFLKDREPNMIEIIITLIPIFIGLTIIGRRLRRNTSNSMLSWMLDDTLSNLIAAGTIQAAEVIDINTTASGEREIFYLFNGNKEGQYRTASTTPLDSGSEVALLTLEVRGERINVLL